jgi:hypothetical protein
LVFFLLIVRLASLSIFTEPIKIEFKTSILLLEYIEPFIDNILSLIAAKERKQVIFCGRVFDNILNEYVIKKKVHEFKLQKTDGTLTKGDYHFIMIMNIDIWYSISRLRFISGFSLCNSISQYFMSDLLRVLISRP